MYEVHYGSCVSAYGFIPELCRRGGVLGRGVVSGRCD
jgi:hypothetical protein